MDKDVNSLIAELRRKHGGELNLHDHHYFLFYQDGLFQLYFDEDEKTIKVDATLLDDSAKIYFTDKKMSKELDIFEG